MTHALRVHPRDPARIRLVQITDTHIACDPGPTVFEGVDTAATLAAVLDAVDAQPERPDCVVLTGDLVDIPIPEAYARLLALLRDRNCPVVCLAGNHDDPVMMARLMNAGAVSTSRIMDFGSWRVLMLNDWLAGSDRGRFSPEELAFAGSELSAAGETPVLICLHHQPVPVGSPWMDAMGLDNGPELLNVTDAYNNVRGMVWGHIHQEFSMERNGIPLLGTPSTCVQFAPGSGEYAVDPLAPGFRVLELLPGGALCTRVVRI
ncbi:MAG: phosphodiesterase [Gammaproteobacteria bacterium]|nr:phosphodiesterase [Gammaproteobacteria bacterium]